MTVYNSKFSVQVEHLGAITTVLDDVQSAVINQGRQNLSDAYSSATMTIEGRNPQNLPSIKIGDFVQLTIKAYNNGVAVTLPDYMTTHIGRVADFVIEYGTIQAMDTWTIVTEDAMAILGRAIVSLTVTDGTVTSAAAKQITDALGLTMTVQGATPSVTTVEGVIFDKENALAAFQKFANTEMAFVIQKGDELIWYPRYLWTDTSPKATFTDDLTASGSTIHNFDGLQIAGLADTSVDEVLISIVNGNTVTSGTGDTYIQFETYSISDTEAVQLASYIKVLFTNKEPQPYSLSFMLTGQNPNTILDVVALELSEIELDYRGNSLASIVMGFSIYITPEVARASLNLLSMNNIQFFILDSATNGILDTNILGY